MAFCTTVLRGVVAIVLAGSIALGFAQTPSSTASATADKAASLRQASTASVTVTGEAGNSRGFDQVALATLPQHRVHAEAHGKAVDCVGPNLIDLMTTVGAPSGEALRGRGLSLYARVTAADGYRVVFALAELDPAMRKDVPIITAVCEGRALDAKEGPFRLVVPEDNRPARWVRQVTAIDLLRAP